MLCCVVGVWVSVRVWVCGCVSVFVQRTNQGDLDQPVQLAFQVVQLPVE